MKRSNLKAGEIYAVRDHGQPCMLLSTDVYAYQQDRDSRRYAAAPDHRPERGKQLGVSRTDYGYLVLNGTEDFLAMLSPGQAIIDRLNGNPYRDDLLPQGTWLTLITSLAAVVGPYAEVIEKRRAADDAYRAKRRADADAWNETRAALSPLLGEDFMPIVEGASPQYVTLTLQQAKLIAAALAAKGA
jgi:hypothetical protein